MAETIISPGVFTRENDISFIQPAPVAAGAAIIGPAVKGPVEVPTLVTSYNDYVRKFGTTFASGSTSYEFLTSIAVKNYFQQGGNSVLVSRVVSGSNNWTRATSTNNSLPNQITGSAELAGSISTNGDGMAAATYTGISLSGGTAGIDAVATVIVDDATTISSIEVTSPGYNYVLGETITIPSSSLGATVEGGTDPIITLTAPNLQTVINAFELETLGKGVIYNNATNATTIPQNSDSSLVSGTADNLRWEVSNVNTDLGTFTLSIRRGDDNLKNKVVIETFNNVSLDPNSGNYIEKIVGNQYLQLNSTENYVETIGEYVNNSNYVRVSAVNLPTLDYLATDGLTINSDSNGLSFIASLPTAQSGSFYNAVGSLFHATQDNKFFKDIDSTNTQGLTTDDYTNTISLLGNTEEYQFNIISAPGLVYELTGHSTQLDSLISISETRGDCIAVVDLVEHGDTVSGATTQAASINSSYAASYWPWLQTQSATGRNEWVPASVVIPGVYAFTDNSSAPWFAPAGLVRGGLVGVIQAERRLSRTDRDTLYNAKVNPIASFPGTGIAVFGQKTLQTKSSALDRVNVRRLLIELKEFLGNQAQNLVFEQNTVNTRNKFLAGVNPYLDSIVERQGLYSYRVKMDDSNNTADVIDRNQLVGQIFIQPAKTAEFIVLDFTVEPTGATFGA